MAQLAIKGHPTRGNEVIKILEMLGGVNGIGHYGNNNTAAYYIKETFKNWINCENPNNLDDFIILTIEEFLEKFPYKVGDKEFAFGNKCTIIDAVWDESIKEVVYTIELDTSKYTTTKLSYQLQPYKEETMEELRIDFPEGYGYAGIENKQVIFTKIKPQYPKTYEECCEITNSKIDRHYFYTKKDKEDYPEDVKIMDSLDNLRRLLICRNAYWKIAGDWKPYFTNKEQKKFTISIIQDEIEFSGTYVRNSLLAFPTVEMRDAFYENFKELIESCKELL